MWFGLHCGVERKPHYLLIVVPNGHMGDVWSRTPVYIVIWQDFPPKFLIDLEKHDPLVQVLILPSCHGIFNGLKNKLNTWKDIQTWNLKKWIRLLQGAIHKRYPIFWAMFWPTYLPISDFFSILKAISCYSYPIFVNLLTYPEIGYALWMPPSSQKLMILGLTGISQGQTYFELPSYLSQRF